MDHLLQPPAAVFSFAEMPQVLLKLAASFLLALPVAWEREVQTRLMGLRTFPIVAMAACAYLLIANEMFSSDQAQARVLQGLVTGMGFIGGGAILKRQGKVEGTATAASLWGTGAMGMAVAYSRLDIAISISLIIFLTLRLLTPLEARLVDRETRQKADTPGRGVAPKEGEPAEGDVADDSDRGTQGGKRQP